MRCPHCQFDNRDGVKFYEECGVKLELKCQNCNAEIPLARKFCGECGLKLTDPFEIPAIDFSKPRSYTPKYLADKILTTRSSGNDLITLLTVLLRCLDYCVTDPATLFISWSFSDNRIKICQSEGGEGLWCEKKF